MFSNLQWHRHSFSSIRATSTRLDWDQDSESSNSLTRHSLHSSMVVPGPLHGSYARQRLSSSPGISTEREPRKDANRRKSWKGIFKLTKKKKKSPKSDPPSRKSKVSSHFSNEVLAREGCNLI